MTKASVCAEILTKWPDTERFECRVVVPGTVWAAGRSFVLKKRDPVGSPGQAKLSFELKVLRHLESLGLPVTLPLAARGGDYFLPHQSRFYTLTPFVVNQPLTAEPTARRGTLLNCGQMIARLHGGLATLPAASIPKNIRRNTLFEEVHLNGVPKLKQFLEGAERDHFATIHAEIESTLAAVYDKAPEQLIHRDCHTGNFLTLNQEVVAIIDWDQLSLGPPLLDVAYFAVQIAKCQINDKTHMKQWQADWQHLVLGYEKVNRLTEADREALFYLLLTIPLLFIRWLLDTNQPHYVSMELDTFYWLYENQSGFRLN